MNHLKPMTIALLAGCGISAGAVHAAGGMDAPPPRGVEQLADQNGIAAMPDGTSVRGFSLGGSSSTVLQGDRAIAVANGDRVELRDGTVYVNGISYGAVTPAQKVEYLVTPDGRTLKVDGAIRTPVR
ncbi:sugar ABC transporter ATPase [Burkholderia lata]|uniref:Sugar ABC transporter ATPase n=2 Tax=Burkholderia lata (strain ATCC 17760 / DSM 23089 / LMG 22485 / NCIMB 9086 / R18194 / 383) TaxID=482957 RepID=A0A6P2V318_BURL3|nr:sugar ABC transporter ATPase [Burkholderia lata]